MFENKIKITAPFWQQYINLIREEMLPFQWSVLNDEADIKIEKERDADHIPAEKSHAIENFKIADGISKGKHYGMVFQDSDVYKWLEAVAYALHQHQDDDLQKIADGVIDLLAKAQQSDGYLNTYFTIEAPERRYKRLYQSHELYCAGHFIEAAVGYYSVTKNQKILDMKTDPSTKPVIEGMESFKPEYYQNHKPILEQETAEGHAVRVMYMCTGMAMLARLNNDEKMFEACKRLWKNIVTKRMYITGGIGSTVIGEAFTADYDLPNDTMYCETCASIGLIFFANNMLKLDVDSQYADIMEKALYNTVIDGMALDGKHFFYVNPLEVVPQLSHKDPGKSHVKTVRPAWFGCACCPPNLARLLSSLDEYMYTVKDDVIYSNLYVSNKSDFKINNQVISIEEITDYPWDGKINFKVNSEATFKLGLRIPNWANRYLFKLNGKEFTPKIEKGYAIIDRTWEKGDIVIFDIQIEANFICANPLVREDYGKVAIQRGPIIYCAEGVDNGDNLHLITIDTNKKINEYKDSDTLGNIVKLELEAEKLILDKQWNDILYRNIMEKQENVEIIKLKLIPYFCAFNRGENEMAIWLKTK